MNPVLGILGGGQLARMTAMAAARLGVETHIFTDQEKSPASQVAARIYVSSYLDEIALAEFTTASDFITIDTENIPLDALRLVHPVTAVSPSPDVVAICQNRGREKNFLKAKGYPVTPFYLVSSIDEFKRAVAQVGPKCVLKTLEMGYDGKGQIKIEPGASLDSIWAEWSGRREIEGIVEAWVEYQMELSVISARTLKEVRSFTPACNHHLHHILDTSIVPAPLPAQVLEEATELAESIASDLGVLGLLAVEMFYTQDGKILVNELAPRPHNSGHYTIDACATSQFEQLVRAVFGWPLGDTILLRPAVMVNLLGDLWKKPKKEASPYAEASGDHTQSVMDRLSMKDWPWPHGSPDWRKILVYPGLNLHLYGKHEARSGRKMGHFTVCASTLKEAQRIAGLARHELNQ